MLPHTERTNPRSAWKTPPLHCGQPHLCQSILTIEFLEDERSEGRLVSNQLLSVLCQHLGVAPKEGVYSWDKMSDLAYKPPPTLSTNAKAAKRGAYMQDAAVLSSSCRKTTRICKPWWPPSSSKLLCILVVYIFADLRPLWELAEKDGMAVSLHREDLVCLIWHKK